MDKKLTDLNDDFIESLIDKKYNYTTDENLTNFLFVYNFDNKGLFLFDDFHTKEFDALDDFKQYILSIQKTLEKQQTITPELYGYFSCCLKNRFLQFSIYKETDKDIKFEILITENKNTMKIMSVYTLQMFSIIIEQFFKLIQNINNIKI